MTEKQESMARESYARATQSAAQSNYPIIFAEFMERGIPADDIRPRDFEALLNECPSE